MRLWVLGVNTIRRRKGRDGQVDVEDYIIVADGDGKKMKLPTQHYYRTSLGDTHTQKQTHIYTTKVLWSNAYFGFAVWLGRNISVRYMLR